MLDATTLEFAAVTASTVWIGYKYLSTNKDKKTAWLKICPILPILLWFSCIITDGTISGGPLWGYASIEYILYMAGDVNAFYMKDASNALPLLLSIQYFSMAHLVAMGLMNYWMVFAIAVADVIITGRYTNKQLTELVTPVIKPAMNFYATLLVSRTLQACIWGSWYDAFSCLFFCLSDAILLLDLLVTKGENKSVADGILITYWYALLLRARAIVA